MAQYEKFNEYLTKCIDFNRSESSSIKFSCEVNTWVKECDFNISAINDGIVIDSYALFVGYVFELINNFISCGSKTIKVSFAQNLIKLNELFYNYCFNKMKLDSVNSMLSKNQILYDISNMQNQNKFFEKAISNFLIESECIEEFFSFSKLSEEDLFFVICKFKDIFIKNLANLSNVSLFKINDLLEKIRSNVGLNNEEETNGNIYLNLMKEIFLDGWVLLSQIKIENEDDDAISLNKTIESISDINLLSADDFNNLVERFLTNYKNLSYEKCCEKGMEGFYFDYKDLDRLYLKNRKILSSISELKSLEDAVCVEINKRDDNNIKSVLLLTNDCSLDEKREILFNFFNIGLNETIYTYIKNNEFGNSDYESIIVSAIDKIINNDNLVNQIIASEHFFNKLESIEIDNELKGDYTFLVASQIKSVERFIKESILKNLAGETIFAGVTDTTYYVDGNKNLDSLTIQNDEVFYRSELGTLNLFLSKCYSRYQYRNLQLKIFDNRTLNNHYSIFNYSSGRNIDSNGKSHTDFYAFFISKIRNGHFHTSIIDSINTAKYCRKETAFWLLCVISELKGL